MKEQVREVVSDDERMQYFPKIAGKRMLTFEGWLFQAAEELSEDYTGGYWRFFEGTYANQPLYYMVPMKKTDFRCSSALNYYEGTMSPEAFGITCSLIALNKLCWATKETEDIQKFYTLKNWAMKHPEAGEILAAID